MLDGDPRPMNVAGKRPQKVGTIDVFLASAKLQHCAVPVVQRAQDLYVQMMSRVQL